VAGGAQAGGAQAGGAQGPGGFVGANLGAEETRVTTPVGAGPAKFVAPIYGGAPKAPTPPAKKGLTTSRASLLAAGAALIVLLGGGGVVWALTNGAFAGDQGAADPTSAAATGPVTPTATVAAVVPADEQCTDEIKANTRWVCLTKATINGSELKIEYEFANGGSNFNISGGFHVHIYGTDASGTNPPETKMGAPSNGPWYVEDKQPSVHEAGSSQYETVEGRAKVCARIATSGHRLVADKSGKGTFKTGNCVPLIAT
jgi:hypothetical protein